MLRHNICQNPSSLQGSVEVNYRKTRMRIWVHLAHRLLVLQKWHCDWADFQHRALAYRDKVDIWSEKELPNHIIWYVYLCGRHPAWWHYCTVARSKAIGLLRGSLIKPDSHYKANPTVSHITFYASVYSQHNQVYWFGRMVDSVPACVMGRCSKKLWERQVV